MSSPKRLMRRGVGRILPHVIAGVAMFAGCTSTPPSLKPVTVSDGTGWRELADADHIDLEWASSVGLSRKFAETADEYAARDFVNTVHPDEFGHPYSCTCGAAHKLVFTRQTRRIGEVFIRNSGWISRDGVTFRVLAGEGSYSNWLGRHGVGVAQPPLPAGFREQYLEAINRGNRELLASFPEPARRLITEPDATAAENSGKVHPLRLLLNDDLVLLRAAVDTFAVLPIGATLGDDRTARVQAAVADVPPAAIAAALQVIDQDIRAMRGAARLYFNLHWDRKLDLVINRRVLPRLVDAMLRSDASDKASILIQLAESDQAAGWAFLRELATGQRRYPSDNHCDPVRQKAHEPSYGALASLFLAIHGEKVPHRIERTALPVEIELDRAAAAIAETLLNPHQPLPPWPVHYPSALLGYAASKALQRQDGDVVSAATVLVALRSRNNLLRDPVLPLAKKLGVAPRREPSEVSLFTAPVDQALAASNPAEAIRQCTEKLPDATPTERTALLLIRATAHESRGEAPAAIEDYTAALKNGGYSPETIHRKLAWLLFFEDRFRDALQHAEDVLRAAPDADMYFLRGVLRYAEGDFASATESDFLTASGLSPGNGYAQIFQHLTCVMGGRPTWSRLRAPPREFGTASPTKITLGPGGSVKVSTAAAAVEGWPATILQFLRDEISEPQFLAAAGQVVGYQCEAHFYIAQVSRGRGDRNKEKIELQAAVNTGYKLLAEYHLAVRQLQEARLR